MSDDARKAPPGASDVLRQQIPEELSHAQILADKISALGGTPAATAAPVQVVGDAKAMLQAALQAEVDTLARYVKRREEAKACGEHGLAAEFDQIIADESKQADLPPRKVFREDIRKAMAVNESGATVPRAPKAARPLRVPDYFMSAVGKNSKALATFEQFSPSHRREYVEWVTEAKTEATRERRLEQTVAWLAEGKPRNWKYTRP